VGDEASNIAILQHSRKAMGYRSVVGSPILQTTTMSNARTIRELYAARRERLARGKCKECEGDRVITKGGRESLFCKDHLDAHNNARTKPDKYKTSAANVVKKPIGRPSVIYDADGDPLLYLDTRAFAEYACLVARAVRKIGRASIADLRRHLGEAMNERYIFDALESLVGAGEIVRVSDVCISRWAIATRKAQQPQTEWNRNQRTIPPSANKSADFESIYGRAAV